LSALASIDARCPSPRTARVAVVAVVGEIDLSNSDVLRVRLLNVLSALRPHRIEVDLAGVTFMDCSGLTVLVVLRQAAARARNPGRPPTLTGMRESRLAAALRALPAPGSMAHQESLVPIPSVGVISLMRGGCHARLADLSHRPGAARCAAVLAQSASARHARPTG